MTSTTVTISRATPAHRRRPQGAAESQGHRWGRVGDAVTTALTLAVVVVASLCLVVTVASRFSPDGDYVVFGHPVLSVVSGSMAPAIRAGDLIIDDHLSATQATHLRVGQIITFRSDGGGSRTFNHRIVAVERSGGHVAYRTKGDANNAPDAGTVAPAQVIGLYQARIPAGGYVLEALRRWETLLAAAVWLALLLFAGPLLRRFAHRAHGRSRPCPGAAAGDSPTMRSRQPSPGAHFQRSLP